VRTFRSLVWAFALLFAVSSEGQVHRQTPGADDQRGDFGSKFFADLRSLFGELRESELARAYQRATAIRCSDLASGKGEWKEVAFLNDDRDLGDWHFDTIEQVKGDLASLVFSGSCFDDMSSVKVASSYPVQETVDRFHEGKLPFGQIVISDNDAVSVTFNRSENAYTFQLPYLYREPRHGASEGSNELYTLYPPLNTSQPDRTVAEEFRCKALSSAELTYRFLLCRTHVVNRDAQLERQAAGKQPLGNAAYFILSDGKEATSSVKLTFDPSVDTAAPSATPPAPAPAGTRPPPDTPDTRPSTDARTPPPDSGWKPAASTARLVEVGQDQFRLRFNPRAWNGRINKPQLLSAQTISDFAPAAAPDRTKQYCTWRPDSALQAARLLEKIDDSVLYTVTFKKELQSVSSAVFEVDAYPGIHLGTLQCFFPQNDTPATITVDRFVSVAGDNIAIEVHLQ
jgi:hypothetical protein